MGLVLGGGGLVGRAYHAGTLVALEHDLDWDPNHAEVIVGTSSGAVTGALLRAGVSPSDMAAWHVDADVADGARLEHVTREPFSPIRWAALLRPQLPTPALASRVLRLVWQRKLVTAALMMLADGSAALEPHIAALRDIIGDEWPERTLLVPAIRQSDGGLVVFGQDGEPQATLTEAVAASCALPGYFAPPEVDGVRYIDGGCRTPTNADALVSSDVDTVVIVSPMSAARPSPWSFDGVMRATASRGLRREVGALEASGKDVIVIEPDADTLAAMGDDLMSYDVRVETVREGFLDVGRELSAPGDARRSA